MEIHILRQQLSQRVVQVKAHWPSPGCGIAIATDDGCAAIQLGSQRQACNMDACPDGKFAFGSSSLQTAIAWLQQRAVFGKCFVKKDDALESGLDAGFAQSGDAGLEERVHSEETD